MHLKLTIDHLLLIMHTAPHLIIQLSCVHSTPFSGTVVAIGPFSYQGKGALLSPFYLSHTKEITFWSMSQDDGET